MSTFAPNYVFVVYHKTGSKSKLARIRTDDNCINGHAYFDLNIFFKRSAMVTIPDQCAVSSKTSRHFIAVQNQLPVSFAVAVIQNIRIDQSYRFTFNQRSGSEKDRCFT